MKAPLRSHRRIGGSRLVSFLAVTFGLFDLLVRAHAADRDSVATSASSEWPFLFLPASSPTTLLSSLFHAEKEAQGEGRHLKASGSPADNSSVNSDKGSGESASANLSPQSGPTMTTTTAASPDDKADPPPEAAEPGLPAHHPLYRMPSRIVATDAQAFAFPFWKQPAPKPALPPSPPNVLNAPASISSSPAFMAWFGTPGSRGNQSDSTSPSEELSESLQTTIVGGGGGQGSTDGSMPPGLQREWFGTRQPYNKESFPSFFSWIWKGGSPDNAETSLSSLVSQKDNQSQTALKNAAHENSSFPWGLWRSKDVALPEQLRQRAALLSAFASTWWFGSCSSSSSSSPVDSVVDGVKKASHKTGEAFREASRAISESSPGGFSSEVPAGPALTQGQQLLSPAIAAVKAAAWWFSEREKEIEDAAKDVLSRSSTNGSSSSMSSLLQQHQQTWFFGESENGDNKETIHQTAEVDEDPSMKKQLLSSLQNAAAWFGHQKNTLQNLDVSKASSWFSGLQALRETGAAESYLWSGSEHDDAVASLSPQKENFERSPKTEETSKKHFFPACWFQQWFWGGETTENDDSGKVDRHTKEKKTKKLALFDPAQIFAIPTKTAIWWSQQEARAPEAVTFFWSLRPSSEKESGLSSDDHRNLHEANGPLRRLSESDKASDVVFSDLLASPPPPPAASAAAAAAASWLWSQKASTADREGGEDKGRVISSSSSPSSFSPSPLESTLAWFWEKQKEDAEKEMSTWFGRKDLPGTAQQDTPTKPSSSSSSSSPQSWLFGRAHNAQTNVGDSLKESLADWFGQWTEAAKSNAKDAVTEVQDKALNKLNEKTAGVQKKASKAAKAGFSAWFWGSSDPVKNTVQTGKAVVKSLTEDDKKKKEEEEEGGGSTEKKSHSLAGQLKSLVFGDGKNKDQDAKKEEVSSSETVSPSPTAASAWWQGPFSTQEGKEGVDPSSMASSWFTRGAGGQSTPKGGEGPIGNLSNASASSFTGSWVGTPSKNSPSYGDEKSRSVASKVASWFEREKKEEKPSSPWNFFSGDHHQGAFFGSSQDSSDISKESLGKSLSGWSWGRSSHGHDDLKEEKDSKESHSHSSSWFPTLNYSHKETRAASSSPSSSALPHASEGGKTSQENGVTSTGKYTQEEGKMTDRQGQSHLDGERVRSPQAGSSSPTTKLPQDVVAGDSSQPGGGLMQAWNWNGGYGGYSGGGQSHPVPEEGPTVRRSGSLWGAAGVSSINNGVPMISSSSASASLFDWGSEEEKKKKEEPLSSSSSSLFEKMSHAMTSRIHEEKVSSSETSSGANIPTQLIAKHAAQAAGWLGMSGDETPHPIRAPGLKRGSYWWEWQANSDGTTSVTTTPPYTRHVHLDCDPTPPFRDCVMKCQSKPSNGAMNAVAEEERRRRTGEPAALGSYEYSNLRSCYMTCRQKWIDADLPGCLRQDGTKVEGIPPVEAFRTTTTTPPATTLPRPRAHTSYPQGSPWEIQDEKKNKESSSFWSRMTGRKTSEEKPIETNTPEEQK
ncbi:transmembrane protein, partial [Cystoisospora suis]